MHLLDRVHFFKTEILNILYHILARWSKTELYLHCFCKQQYHPSYTFRHS